MKVSVVIPMYNSASFIDKTLKCVLAQTFNDFEVIVVDDGSTDGSADVVRAIGDARIQVIDKPNTGVSDTRNVGLRAARGEYIASLDSDDYWYPDHLSEAMAFFEEHLDVKWYGARQYSIPYGTEPPHRSKHNRDFGRRNFFIDGKRYVNSTNLVFRREVLKECGEYPSGVRYFEDWIFQGQIAAKYPIIGTNECVTSIYYRQRPGSGSATSSKPDVHFEAIRYCIHRLERCVLESRVKTPLWVWGLLRILYRTSMFHCPLDEMIGFVDEFSSLQGTLRANRWKRFLKWVYALADERIEQRLGIMAKVSCKQRFGMMYDCYRELGFGCAMRWLLIVLLYSCRGVADAVQDRFEVLVKGRYC